MNDTLVMVKIIIKNILDILLFRKPNGFFGAWIGVYFWILIINGNYIQINHNLSSIFKSIN